VVSANPRQNDAIVQLHPLDRFTRQRLSEGRIPLWNPYLGAGTPHLATGFTRALYPPFWLTLPFGPENGRNVEILLHLVMAGTFQFLYLRFMGCRWAAAMVGALAFAWSGALILRTPLNYIFDTLAWLPAVLLGVEKVLRSSRHAIPWLALAGGMQLLAGSLPDLLSCGILVGCYVAVRMLHGTRPSARVFLSLLTGVVLAAGLAAAQLVPQLELVALSQRGRRTYEDLRATGASWRSVVTLISPFIAGAEFSRFPLLWPTARVVPLYVGAVSLVLMPAALRWGKSALLALGIGGASVFAVAAGTPALYALYLVLPAIAGLRYVHTLAHVFPVALASAAGWGAEAWMSETEPMAPTRPAVAAAAVAALAMTFAGISVAATDEGMAGAAAAVSQGLAFMGGALLLRVARRRGWISARALGALLILLLAMELRQTAARNNPVISPSRFPVLPWTPALRMVRSDPVRGRAIGVQPKDSGRFGPWVIGANLFQSYGIEDAGAYHSLLPERLVRYHTLMARMAEGATPEAARTGGRYFFVNLEHHGFRATALARLMNVRYLFYRPGDVPPPGQGLRLAYTGEVDVYQFTGHLPRAFLVDAFDVVPDPEQVLTRLVASDFTPRHRVLLEEPPAVVPLPGSIEDSSVELLSDEPEMSVYQVRSPAAGLLVLTDSMYPGWTARVNGSPAPLLRADYLFRAVALPGGTSRVEFRYEPRSFRLGVAVSLVSVALLLGLSMYRFRR
jgi:hypothetical protein